MAWIISLATICLPLARIDDPSSLLHQSRRIHCHVVKEGPFSGLEQLPVGDMELITCDNAGSVKWWDSDVSDKPLSMLVTWSPQVCCCDSCAKACTANLASA